MTLSILNLSLTGLALLGMSISGCSSKADDGSADGASITRNGIALANGYLAFANICIDSKNTKTCADEDESLKTLTDDKGEFSISALAALFAEHALIVESKDDGSTLEGDNAIPTDKKLVLSTPPDKTAAATSADDIVTVSPLSTLINAYQRANRGSVDNAENQIKSNLGIESENVSLFDDYIGLFARATSKSDAYIKRNKIYKSDATDADVYRLLNHVAEITSETIKKAISDVKQDNLNNPTAPKVTFATELDSLLAIVSMDIIDKLQEVVIEIDKLLDPINDFNAVSLIQTVDLNIDLVTLEEDIKSQEQISSTTKAGIEAIFTDGASAFFIYQFLSDTYISKNELLLSSDKISLMNRSSNFDSSLVADGFVEDTFTDYEGTDYYMDDSSGNWTQSNQNNVIADSIKYNADGSADLFYSEGNLNITAAINDIEGVAITDYATRNSFTQVAALSTRDLFSAGAQAIRFSATTLNDTYNIDTQTPAIGTNGLNASSLTELIMPSEVTPASSGLNGNTLACGLESYTLCVDVELVGNVSSNAVGTSGTSYFYLVDKTGTDAPLLIDTGSWQIEQLNNEVILKASYPISVKNKLISFNDGAKYGESGLIFSVFNNSKDIAVHMGTFTAAGEEITDDTWYFNSIAADSIQQALLNEFGGPADLIGEGGFVDNGSGTQELTTDENFILFQTDHDNSTTYFIAASPGETFSRIVSGFTQPIGGEVYSLSINYYDAENVLITPQTTIFLTIDATDPTIVSAVTLVLGQTPISSSNGSFVVKTEPSLLTPDITIELTNPTTQDTTSLKIKTISATTDPIEGTNINAVVEVLQSRYVDATIPKQPVLSAILTAEFKLVPQ